MSLFLACCCPAVTLPIKATLPQNPLLPNPSDFLLDRHPFGLEHCAIPHSEHLFVKLSFELSRFELPSIFSWNMSAKTWVGYVCWFSTLTLKFSLPCMCLPCCVPWRQEVPFLITHSGEYGPRPPEDKSIFTSFNLFYEKSDQLIFCFPCLFILFYAAFAFSPSEFFYLQLQMQRW